MKRNVEIKAAVTDLEAIREKVAGCADWGPFVLDQEDVFFQSPRARLKLRRFGDGRPAELIAYERPDVSGAKESRYIVHPTSDPDGLQDALTIGLGVRGVVRKHRALYLIDRTRVHLDRVEGLGDFVELEVVLSDDEPTDDALVAARRLMADLGIREDQLVDKAYIDLRPRA